MNAVLVQTYPADAARIRPAGALLHFGDNLHGAQLGRSAHRPRREGGGQHIQGVQPFQKLRRDAARHVHDMGEALHGHEPLHFHGAGPCDVTEVVASQIHKHHVFSPFLGIGEQL